MYTSMPLPPTSSLAGDWLRISSVASPGSLTGLTVMSAAVAGLPYIQELPIEGVKRSALVSDPSRLLVWRWCEAAAGARAPGPFGPKIF